MLTGLQGIHSRCQLFQLCEPFTLTRQQVILYLSYFYKSRELPIRLSFFWTSFITTQIVAAFLAYGILIFAWP